MRHYCSLTDSKYLPQLLVLYDSLKRHSSEPFTLSVLPLDDECAMVLEQLRLPNLVVLWTRAFEQEQQLGVIKANRTRQEYAWTCASNLCEWLLFCADCELSDLVYLDADMMFFSDPKVIFDEMPDQSIGIIPHRLIPSKRHLAVNGAYNVSWVYFRNDGPGRECLSRWAAQVRERCSATAGCGDQLYLDEWPARYGNACHVLHNLGAGLAPWNLANYDLKFHDGKLYVTPTMSLELYGNAIYQPAVFVHYHEFRENPDGTIRLTNYELRPEDRELIYEPYLVAYRAAKERIASLGVLSEQ